MTLRIAEQSDVMTPAQVIELLGLAEASRHGNPLNTLRYLMRTQGLPHRRVVRGVVVFVRAEVLAWVDSRRAGGYGGGSVDGTGGGQREVADGSVPESPENADR